MREEIAVEMVDKIPPPPKWMSATGKKIYRAKSIFLLQARILSHVDVEMFISFCHEFGRYIETTERLAEVSHEALLDEGSLQQYNRLMKINKESYDRARALAPEFGFTPISRMKFSIDKDDKPDLMKMLE